MMHTVGRYENSSISIAVTTVIRGWPTLPTVHGKKQALKKPQMLLQTILLRAQLNNATAEHI
jgi:hypothetical protein